MGQRWLLAVTTSAVVMGAADAAAQSHGAPLLRAFERVFSTPKAPPSAPSLAPRLTPPALPASPTKCHVVVIPADPRLDRRMSIAPPASRRFTIREATPLCR
jgi:hypothetical protein